MILYSGFFCAVQFLQSINFSAQQNICNNYIYELIHQITWSHKDRHFCTQMPEVESLSYLWSHLHKDTYDGRVLLQNIDWSAVLLSDNDQRLTKYLHFDHKRYNKAQSCDTLRTMAELKVTIELKWASCGISHN